MSWILWVIAIVIGGILLWLVAAYLIGLEYRRAHGQQEADALVKQLGDRFRRKPKAHKPKKGRGRR